MWHCYQINTMLRVNFYDGEAFGGPPPVDRVDVYGYVELTIGGSIRRLVKVGGENMKRDLKAETAEEEPFEYSSLKKFHSTSIFAHVKRIDGIFSKKDPFTEHMVYISTI
jgi:hypothetical protein